MLVFVIDIQSDIVEGSLIEFPKLPPSAKPAPPQHPRTIYSTLARIPRKANTHGDYLTKMMLKSVEDICLHVTREMKTLVSEPITAVHYILSSPWIISQSKTVKIDYKKSTEINEETVKEVIEADRKELIAKYESDMVFIEQKVFDVELNGYSVEKYSGKSATTLKISFAFTLSSDKIIKRIQTAVAKHLHARSEEYHSAILLQFLSSRARAAEKEEYIVLHVHGELTDVVVVKNGFSSYLASFPFGVSTLIRKVGVTMRSGFETAGSTLSMYAEKKLNESQQKKVESITSQIFKGWQAGCTHAFQGIGQGVILPRTVHLYMESPLLPLFVKSLEDMQFEVRAHEGPLREIHSFALKDVI